MVRFPWTVLPFASSSLPSLIRPVPLPPPRHTTRFELEVLAPLDRRVVSNTPVMMSNEESVVLPSGRKGRRRRWRFAETPVMSTYLLALVRTRFRPPIAPLKKY